MPRNFRLLRKAKPQPEDTFVVSELEDTSIVLRRVPELCTKPSRLRRFKQRLTEDKRNIEETPSYTMPQIQCAAYTHFQGELRYYPLNSIKLKVSSILKCFFSLKGCLFVTGGWASDEDGEVASVSFIDLQSGECYDVQSMRIPRAVHASAASSTDIFVCGGFNQKGILSSCERYDVKANK